MRWYLVLLFVLSAWDIVAQSNSAKNWETLAGLEYEESTDEYGEVFVPKFGPLIQNLEGREIELSGYIVPFEDMFSADRLIVSALPIASCFFCGGSGLESVAEVYLKKPVKYTAKKITVTGRLRLNSTDVEQLMYILEDAEMKMNQ